MAFRKERDYVHGTIAKTAVVFVNLGTPDAPTPAAVRRYLKEFLSDRRVVEIPRLIWWCILNGIILPIRSKQSAKKYASIWRDDGSPLQVHTAKQSVLLRGYLGDRGHEVKVVYAMRYGTPALPEVLKQLHAEFCERILILPAYPQYSATTTASIFDSVFDFYRNCRNVPELRFVKHYHDHPAYIDALKKSVLHYWSQNGRPDKLVMSFHGVPKRTLLLGDPYHCECHKTARLLATALGLAPEQWQLTFQSRFGRAQWLQPYTAPTISKLAQAGTRRVDVVCPGFTSDCLETLEEIAMEVKHAFLSGGGQDFHYIPCLNQSAASIHALADVCDAHLAGWPTRLSAAADSQRTEAARQSASQAKAAGATV